MGKKKKKCRIRPLALCVFRREDKIFVAAGHDAKEDQVYYRPIGGRIEFGEPAAETVRREVMEEINRVVDDVVYLGTLENIFTYEGKPGHEIVLIFDGRFVDEAMNDDLLEVTGQDDGKVLFTATWKPLEMFKGVNAPPLYPNGLLDLLDGDHTD